MKIIEIGSLKLTIQSLITAICGIVLGITVLTVFPSAWPYGLLLVLTFLINSYTINCVSVGHCNVWAWFLVAMMIITLLYSIGALIILKKAAGIIGTIPNTYRKSK